MASDIDPFAAIPARGATGASPDSSSDPFAGIAPSKFSSEPAAAPSTSLGHKAALVGSSLLSGLEQGTGGLLDLGRATVNSMLHPLDPLAKGNLPDPSITNAIMAPGNALGLTGEAGPQPEGTGEALVAAGARGLGSAIPFALAGQPLAALGSGTAGGLAGEGAKDLGAPSWAQTGASILAGLGVGGVASVANNISKANAAAEAVTNAQRELATAQAAVDAAKIANPLALGARRAELAAAKDTATNAVAQAKTSSEAARDATTKAAQDTIAASKSSLDKTLALHDSAGAESEAARDAQIAQGVQSASGASKVADQNIASVAAAHGISSTLQDAGEKLQQGARSWLTKDLPTKQAAAWAPVDSAIAPTTSTPLTGFASALGDINRSAGALEPVAQLLKPRLPAQLQTTLGHVLDSPADTPITWANVQKLRSTLGDAMGNPMTVKDIGAQNLSRLYATLTGDMGKVADEAGAGKAFAEANAESTRLYGVAEGPIAKVVSGPKASLADDPAPGKMASGLLNGAKSGNTDLDALAKEGLPVRELTAAQLREDPSAYAKLSPEAQQTLVPDPAHRATLDASLATKAGEGGVAKAAADSAKAAHQAELDRLADASAVAKDAHSQTVASAQSSIDAANAAHRATMETAKENVKFGPRTSAARVGDLTQTQNAEGVARAQALHEAKTSVASAKENALIPTQSAARQALSHAAESIVGGGAGEAIAELASHSLHLAGVGVPPELGRLLGFAAPMLFRGAKNAITNPMSLSNPIIGGYAGNTRP